MSTRRKIGDIVRKKAHAGFVGESSMVLIPNSEENFAPEPCWGFNGCEDEHCQQWPTVWEVAKGADGNWQLMGGTAYHVSECEMEDA